MKRILVVEDEASIRELVALNLKMTGWEVLEAPSAERALELIQKNPPCDVALLDIMLPGMDGFSLCETIRHGDPYIGIIMASAKGQESDKIRGLSIGADDYITKPFSVSELVAPGTPIMSLVVMDDAHVVLNIREDLMPQFKMGGTFRADVPAIDGKDIEFRIYYISPLGSFATWKSTKQTGSYDMQTFEIHARPTQQVEGLRPGMSVLLKMKNKK